MKGMLVFVYRCAAFGDSTNNGVTARHTQMILIDPSQKDSQIFEPQEGDDVLVVDHRGGRDHPFLTPIARPAKVIGGHLVPAKGWTMFGGNYVTTSDSRFREAYGHVLPVHDRIE